MLRGMTRPTEGWPRLASYVVSARIDAGFREQRALAAVTGISERTLGKLENGQPVGATTLVTVAKHLGWTPDSPQRIRDGGEPVLVREQEGAMPDPGPVPRKFRPLLDADEDEIAPYDKLVWDDVAAAISKHHMPPRDIPGAAIFPDDHWEARAWDDPRFRDEAAAARWIAKFRMIKDRSDEGSQTG
jgi:transcriptional regulator with XRE-family HTH domain